MCSLVSRYGPSVTRTLPSVCARSDFEAPRPQASFKTPASSISLLNAWIAWPIASVTLAALSSPKMMFEPAAQPCAPHLRFIVVADGKNRQQKRTFFILISQAPPFVPDFEDVYLLCLVSVTIARR